MKYLLYYYEVKIGIKHSKIKKFIKLIKRCEIAVNTKLEFKKIFIKF